jgi:hypothetical protein
MIEDGMTDILEAWDGDIVRKWLERRVESSRLDQAAADKRGYEARDDYDKAAAEEWVCAIFRTADCTNDQAAFIARLKELLGQDEYRATGIHDDQRFERHVRANLRKLTKMAKTKAGFRNLSRYQ